MHLQELLDHKKPEKTDQCILENIEEANGCEM